VIEARGSGPLRVVPIQQQTDEEPDRILDVAAIRQRVDPGVPAGVDQQPRATAEVSAGLLSEVELKGEEGFLLGQGFLQLDQRG
jgi:hypothetical protein